MIIVDSSDRSERALDAQIVFASQLSTLGCQVAIDDSTISHPLGVEQSYQIAAYLAEITADQIERVVVLVSGPILAPTLTTLRSYRLNPGVDICLIGRFDSRQAQIDVGSAVAYATGREPLIVNLKDWQKKSIHPGSPFPQIASRVAPKAGSGATRITLVLAPDALALTDTQRAIAALQHSRAFTLQIIAATEQSEPPLLVPHHGLALFKPDALLPAQFAAMTDVLAVYDCNATADRIVALCLDVIQSGRVVLDCTGNGDIVASGAPALRGPKELSALGVYLDSVVLNNLDEIRRQVGKDSWLRAHSTDLLQGALSLKPAIADPLPSAPARTVFFPTNGNGLGHASRCLLIADAMKPGVDPVFAAFPSCVPLIEDRGYACLPLVQRSHGHSGPHAHDLINHLRFGRSLARGDRFIFDGGDVPHSVSTVIWEKALAAIWIRRGLWQPGQIDAARMARHEAAFRRVIVPLEAFDELNDDYSHGAKICRVGPIVNAPRLDAIDPPLRDTVAAAFGCKAQELVITMLGGHVFNIDRVAQTQAICNVMERRKNALHLVLVWPGSRVSPSLYNWSNTHVVQTRHALDLCRSADLVITAAGYNSFHECLYHHVPAIFMPQIAPFMDDQERRARAASDRGLAETVLPNELLRLEREILAFLDQGKATDIRRKLAATILPAQGTKDAAALIEGLAP